MLIKRPVYNQQLKCVAIEIIANERAPKTVDLLTHFTALLQNTENDLPLFIPYALKTLLEKTELTIVNPIILKLYAGDINQTYLIDDIKSSTHSIALMIDNPDQLTWIDLADYIALNEQMIAVSDIIKVVKFIQAKKRKVIAYNVAHLLNFDQCKAMTMDYYCGNFLFQPQIDEKIGIASNKLNLLTLINTLQQKDAKLETIYNLIKNDPLLSFQLLKLANSAAFSGYRAVESIDQAVLRLGLVNLKNWVMILSLKNISKKPKEIIESGLTRALMAQKLAAANPAISSHIAYTTGLLSVLDSLLDCTMAVLLDKITLTQEVRAALLAREGELGKLIDIVINYEKGNWEQLNHHQYFDLDISEIYIDCMAAVNQDKKMMSEAA